MGHHGNSFLSFGVAPVVEIGGWIEIGRTTLGSSQSDFDVSGFDNKRYYMVLANTLGKNNPGVNTLTRLGNGTPDAANNYAYRFSSNGATDIPATNQSQIQTQQVASGNPDFTVNYVANLSAQEKLLLQQFVQQNAVGAGTVPTRQETVGKWVNTSNPMDVFGYTTAGAFTYDTGSEIVVLGWDPADVHTTNFWEELASVDLSGGTATSLSTGTFTAKKYLWLQFYGEATAGNVTIRMGNGTVDSGSVYAGRTSSNGGSDTTDASQTAIQNSFGAANFPTFVNMFMVNNAANEKLIMFHNVQQVVDGDATAPSRRESVWKYVNTSTQVNIIDLITSAGNFTTNTRIKVWGSN